MLTGLDRSVWDILLLRGSARADRASRSGLSEYLRAGVLWGQREAAPLTPEQLSEYLARESVPVRRMEESGPRMIHSDYCWDQAGSAVIHLYMPVLDELAGLIRPLTGTIDREGLVQLHIAHECFHHMVRRGLSQPPASVPPARSLWRRLFPNDRDALLEELAAHAFAQQLCAFPCHPMLLDWLLMQRRDAASAQALLAQCITQARDLKGVGPEP